MKEMTNAVCVALVSDGQTLRERLQLVRLGQRRDEGVRIDVHFLLDRAGTEIEVKASLEPLANEVAVRRHQP
jgi:hypothetical protein